jgi:NAD(P)-dependent dehydrogenase (short-subunit alcohol dehydrogenase family)
MQYGINHLGHFYLTHLLWPKLNKSNFFRVINLSSLAHKKLFGFFGTPAPDFTDMNFEKNKYLPALAYSRSKLYNNLFTHALAERIIDHKGISVSLHPGVVRT